MRTRRRTLYGRVAVTNRNKKDLFEEEKRSFSTIFLRKNSRDKLFFIKLPFNFGYAFIFGQITNK